MSNERTACFPVGKWKLYFSQNQPLFSVALTKVIVLFLMQIKDKLFSLPRVNYYTCTWGVHLRECKQKKKPILIFKSVRIRECANTEFDWKVKWGIEHSV